MPDIVEKHILQFKIVFKALLELSADFAFQGESV